jgi:hypothetical protein
MTKPKKPSTAMLMHSAFMRGVEMGKISGFNHGYSKGRRDLLSVVCAILAVAQVLTLVLVFIK